MARERKTRPCATCGGKRTCRWVDDAWYCQRCGDEWYEPSDEAKGDCFEVAAHLILWDYADDPTAVVVHGWPIGQGKIAGQRHWHAWIETTKTLAVPVTPRGPDGSWDGTWDGETVDVDLVEVIDRSNGKDVVMAQGWYYNLGRIERRWRYTRDEVAANLRQFDHYGPWVPDEPE